MFYAYILLSLKKEIYYKGSTENLAARIQQHNDGLVAFTSKYRPCYYEIFSTRAEAMNREKFFKSGKDREWLKNNIKDIS